MAHFYTYVDADEMDKMYMGDSGTEDDDQDDLKTKNRDTHMTKMRKGTRL